jgi:hypothetical protein
MSDYTPKQRKKKAPLIQRFWEKIDKRGPDECWPWLGSRLKRCGHGRININGTVRLAHRVAYELQNGPIPPGLVVRHRCNFAPCCNPAHLELGTQADNMRDIRNNREPVKVPVHPLPDRRPWARFNGRNATPQERFWDKVDDSGECWLWMGAKYSNGYGHFVINRRDYLAHRLAWEWVNGAIPDGTVLMHLCDTPACVRVSHLRLGTPRENSLDMVRKGRQHLLYGKDHPGFGKRRVRCMKGHDLTEDNVVFTDHGKSRRCLICYRASNLTGAKRYIVRHYAEVMEKRRRRRDGTRVGLATGERHGLTTLTEEQVREMRFRHGQGDITFRQLACEYDVCAATVRNIVLRYTWRHVP